MIELDGILLDEEIITNYFLCDINKCKGECCTFPGEFGAPLNDNEIFLLDSQVDIVKHNLSKKSLDWIKKHGTYQNDKGKYTTNCINKRDCVFVYYKNKTALCAIEKEYLDNKTSFRKPISCWLFPIRVATYRNQMYLYYEEIEECKDAIKNGEKINIKIYQALKQPLIYLLGFEWYKKLEKIAKEYNKEYK
ncbi:MAG: DUF3109 family protein [Bacteroidetes bacterium]|nr:DUF3109 family protein [Bacteroidota bacterium]